MRQLNRLNQFQRLWQQSLGATQRTCIAEMARHCICSERHMRTLLSQWQQTGWLRWQGESGRGKQGSLEFLYSPEQLRQQLLQHHLQHHLQCGDTTDALKMLDLAPEKLLNLLQPLMGVSGKTIRPCCVCLTTGHWKASSRYKSTGVPNNIWFTNFFRPDAVSSR